MIDKIKELGSKLQEPSFKSSYETKDCIFLLKDISTIVKETTTESKEEMINNGISYSEMLPVENLPSREYLNIFLTGVKEKKQDLADKVATIAELMYSKKGQNLVIVSLARAGTPIGILVKRYLNMKYGVHIPHYSISIIRGKGFDTNAIVYIINKHKNCRIQFVDGWTGKGAIGKELTKSCNAFNEEFETELDDSLAVLADPSGTATICATREDIYLPNCCLNSTVSGLVSRTFTKSDIIGEYDFHGAKFYKEWYDKDYSNYFIDEITECFNTNTHNPTIISERQIISCGINEVIRIKDMLSLNDINKIKPSIGETTRVLLRRSPDCILINNLNNPDIKHILYLANEKGVSIKVIPDMIYECVGIIR